MVAIVLDGSKFSCFFMTFYLISSLNSGEICPGESVKIGSVPSPPPKG